MTNLRTRIDLPGGRQRPPILGVAFLVASLAMLLTPLIVRAHAEPERTSPPINGVVDMAPAVVEIWFSEEAESDGTTILVIGPGGVQVDLGDAALDLNDPERKHVTVSLRDNLGPGAYTVQWHSVSAEDGDEAQGGYLFTVGGGTPAASPVSADQQPPATVEAAGTPEGAAATEESDFDSRAFGLSVGVGLIAAVAIYLFWRRVRPKNPMFRG